MYLSKTKVKGTGFFPHTSNFLFIPSIESQQKINEVSIVKKSLFLEILPSKWGILTRDVFSENSPLEWQNPVDYYPAGYAPQEMQYDYNNYYAGPCMEPPIIWDNGCGNAGEVPYCDQATCTQNCLQFMNSAKGVCIDYECFCEKTETVTEKPKPEQDWSHDNQNGTKNGLFF